MDFSRYDDEIEDDSADSSPRRERSRRGGCLGRCFLLGFLVVFFAAAGVALFPFLATTGEGSPHPEFIKAVNSLIKPSRFSCKTLSTGWFSPTVLTGVRFENPRSGAEFTADSVTFSNGLLKMLPLGRFTLGTVTVEAPKLCIDARKRRSAETDTESGRFLFLPVVDAKCDLLLRRGEVELTNAGNESMILRNVQGAVSLVSIYESLRVSLTMAPANGDREAEVDIRAAWRSGGIQIDELKIVSPWLNASGSGRLTLADVAIPDNALRISAKADATAISRDFRPLSDALPRMIGNVEFEINAKQFANHAAVSATAKLEEFAIAFEDGKNSAVDGAALKCDFSVPCRNGAFLPEVRDCVWNLELKEGGAKGKIESWRFGAPHAAVKNARASIKCPTPVFTRALGLWMDRGIAKTLNQITPDLESELTVDSQPAGGTLLSATLQPFDYCGLYAGESSLRLLFAGELVKGDFSANVNGGKLHLNPVFHPDGRIEAAGKIRALERVKLTQEMVDAWLPTINPFFAKSRLDDGSVTLDVLSFRIEKFEKPETIALQSQVAFSELKMTPGPEFDKPLKFLKLKNSKLSFPEVSTRLDIAEETVRIGEMPFRLGGMNFALSGDSSFKGKLDYTLKVEITEQLLRDNKLLFLAPLFKGKMIPVRVCGTVENPQVETGALISGLRDIFNIPLK